jgi:hypothetical protein
MPRKPTWINADHTITPIKTLQEIENKLPQSFSYEEAASILNLPLPVSSELLHRLVAIEFITVISRGKFQKIPIQNRTIQYKKHPNAKGPKISR